MKIDGRCHCGEITFEAEVDPDALHICHCTDCQTLSGSAFHEHPGIRRAFCASGHTEDLYQDCRKRQQTPPRLLRHLRHSDLCLRSGQCADLRLARRYDHSARRLRPAAADLAAVCTALGGTLATVPAAEKG